MRLVIALLIKIQVFSLVSAANFDFNFSDFQVAAKRFKRATKSKCLQPPVTSDKSYNVKFQNSNAVSGARPGEAVPEFTIVDSQCNKGYAASHQTAVPNTLPSVCKHGSWQPPVLKCKRFCNNFAHFSNFKMSCYGYFGGPKISCTGVLLEGSIAIPRCQKKFHPNVKVNYEYATCREDGTWDKSFFKCIPDCGKVASSSVVLLSGGYPEKRGGAPWNVAIYSSERNSKTPEFICGGTLITEDLVISAAHCFYDEVFHKQIDSRFFHAVVGKVTRDYKKQDYPTTKIYRFKDIIFPETTYRGAGTNYASDIALLQLSGKVSFSQDVLPACLYWNDRERFNPGENVKGKLSGFGVTEKGSLASTLLSAYLPYISYKECLKKVREDFLGSISVDKFCAGSEKAGPGARAGDSGGGLLFMDKETGLYHLRGVVSNKDLSTSSIATFTDMTQYMSWILKMMEVIEHKSVSSEVAKRSPCPAHGVVTNITAPYTRHAHPDDCRKYYICVEGVSKEFSCPIGTVFKSGDHLGSGKCDDDENVPGCEDYYSGLDSKSVRRNRKQEIVLPTTIKKSNTSPPAKRTRQSFSNIFQTRPLSNAVPAKRS